MMSEQRARIVMDRIETLATFSEEPGRLTRRSFTPAMRQANAQVASWMRAAGMTVHEDSIGNLIGHYAADRPEAPTLLLGSHLDSVRDAGKYDGPLGVLVALACVEALHQHGKRLPCAIEIIAFADEEGLRFQSSYLGSSVVAGRFDPQWLTLRDADGITLAEAVRAFGGDPAALAADARQPGAVLGYCEVHIEQGPVLEAQNLPVGIVTGITGANRASLRFSGVAGHAGTVPMALRRDALCAAAAFILAAEELALEQAGLVATVGQISAAPGASNVIPGAVALSLDLRHQNDAVREAAYRALQARAQQIADARGVSLDWELVQASRAVLCAPALRNVLERAVEACGYTAYALPSGAGHDAAALAALCPVAMLFVRCAGGISHNPAEAVTTEDVAVAIDVLGQFIALLAGAL